MQVAVLGMGRMGKAVAVRVLGQGHEVRVWNRTPGRAGELLSAGAEEVETPSVAAAGADVVVTMLSDDDAVRAVVLGEGGVSGSLGDDAVLVDSSTVSPELGAELAARIGCFVSMPILGNPEAVRGGTALLLVGGDDEAVRRAQPVVSALGGRVLRYGRPEQAAAAKLTSNLLLLDGLVALAEAFAVGTAGGLTEEQLRELLAESPLVAPALRNRFEALLTGKLDSWWTTALGAKDASLALALRASEGDTLPLTTAALGVYRAVIAAGRGDDDIAAVRDRYLS